MGDISRIANVQIALNTTGISTLGFSTMLVVGTHIHSLARVLSYTSADDMIADGFSADDPLYLAVVDGFSQTPRPAVIKVGRRRASTTVIEVAEVLAAGTYTIKVKTKDADGEVTITPYTFTNTGGNAEAIMTGLQNLITNDTDSVITATLANERLTIASKTGDDYALELTGNLSMGVPNTTETIANTMAAITASDNDFYGICMTSRSTEDILAMANWTEAHIKLFGTATSAAGAKDADVSTDIMSQLMNNNFYRTFIFYHENADTDFPECAVMSRCFAIDPGGETWALKKLAGVTTDGITETEYNAITKKNGNTFERFRNISITQNGKVAAGEWIDVIRFRDWLQEEITVNVFNLLINRDKVPYTDEGIALIETQIRAALKLGQRRGGIAPDEYDEDGNTNLGFTVEVPLAANISPNQKASRILNDVKFTARLAGAIHVVNIKGSLTYENLIDAA